MSLIDYRPMQERCSNCSYCKWCNFDKIKNQEFAKGCPSASYYYFNTYSARGKFQLGQSILDGEAEYSESTTKAIHACMSCGACDVACKITRYNLEPLEHNIALKKDAVDNGAVLPAQTIMIDALKNEQTMIVNGKKENRANWAEGLGLKDLIHEKADVMFFPGCKYIYDENLKNQLDDMVDVLLKAGVDMGYLNEADACCGGRALQMGFTDAFEDRATTNMKIYESAGVKTIVTPCSDCYYAFKHNYAQLGMEIEVLHIVEYIERLINEGKLQFTKTVPLTVTYHDPCHLGRLGETYVPWKGEEKKIFDQIHTWEPKRPRYNGAKGIYDAPRNIINAIPGVTLVEMDRIKEYAWCCGAGGGCSETFPEFSEWTAGERITEANSTGAQALITACPWCVSNLHGVSDKKGITIPVLDIIQLIQRAL